MRANPPYMDPTIWGPPYWFFLHTAAFQYPDNPNDIVKKKYYEFILNFPLFIPDRAIAVEFENVLNENTVQPYLRDRASLVTWMHHIHNLINTKCNKPRISMAQFINEYYEQFKPAREKNIKFAKIKEKIVYTTAIVVLLCVIYQLLAPPG